MLSAPHTARPQNLFRIALTRSVIGHVLFILVFLVGPLVRSLFTRELPAGSPFYVDLATPGLPPQASDAQEEKKQQEDEIKVPPKPEIKKPDKKKEPEKKDDKAKAKPVTNTVAKATAKPNAPPKKKLSEAEIRKMLESGMASVNPAGEGGGKRGLGGTGTGPMTEMDDYFGYVYKVMYEAWSQPSELADSGVTATVKIRVMRDGTVSSRDMVRPSGNSVMDKSVMNAVNGVNRLRPLPPSADGTYTDITIDFELTAAL